RSVSRCRVGAATPSIRGPPRGSRPAVGSRTRPPARSGSGRTTSAVDPGSDNRLTRADTVEEATSTLPRTRTKRSEPMSPRVDQRIANFASILDDTTRAQAEALTHLPFVQPHIALMPDAHAGKGSSVGTVIPTVGAVIP